MNYFKARKQFSSGLVEGLNNKAKVTMRRSYGFRTFRVLELALYHTLGKTTRPGAYPRILLTILKVSSICYSNRPNSLMHRAFLESVVSACRRQAGVHQANYK